MDEFFLINTYFKPLEHARDDVILGIGDDAACLDIPLGQQLVVSCDTLVSDIHFLNTWDPYDIAYRAVMVNVSDMAAMGATPSWLLLALTMPSMDKSWLKRFSNGLHEALNQYNIALIGGDTTRGPLSMTLTIHGLVSKGKAIRRGGAKVGDIIYVSGVLGAAALAVWALTSHEINEPDQLVVMKKLLHPNPRIDLVDELQAFATAAIDISDGLSADLNHICEASQVGACLTLDAIPVHPLLKKYKRQGALDFALSGGDDYELCFTVLAKDEPKWLARCAQLGLVVYPIGVIEEGCGLRAITSTGEFVPLRPHGYGHF